MTSPPPTREERLEERMLSVALGAAREAASLQRARAGTLASDRWSEKGTSDFVTEVDRESERRIVGRIRAAFPTDRILAEEGSGAEDPGGASATLWIVDPLDGTTNWLHGYPEYAVSIAALDAGGLSIGVVVNSATGEAFTAIRGAGARRDGRPIGVSRVSELRLALLGTGFPFKRTEMIPDYLRVLGRALQTTSGVRRGGAAALDLCDVACGRLDGFWEHWLMPWDVAAGALILREAGGSFAGLPGAAEPTLRDAATRGRAVADAFSGGRAPGPDEAIRPGGPASRGAVLLPTDGAAFAAGNGRIDGAIRRLLEETLVGGADGLRGG